MSQALHSRETVYGKVHTGNSNFFFASRRISMASEYVSCTNSFSTTSCQQQKRVKVPTRYRYQFRLNLYTKLGKQCSEIRHQTGHL